ncbi:helicase-related protein [Massilia sp.]|uniref:helicase-related protein n=1 Tax=Massilia sp. TaxID=1882437 RepID=UPI00289B4350|nr:helicase-related protein [Massilia sp.]
MSKMSKGTSSRAVMQGLKDFQRRTVDFAFSRMFGTDQPALRFLVADEVGLGKTLVARGLIARTIERLQGEGRKRVDVIYVCSNADIAAQNVARLMQPGQPAFSEATRLTLLPLMTSRLKEHPVNFISFTPGTTFSQANRTGRKEERRLIYQMLIGVDGIDQRGLRNAMKAGAGDGWYVKADEALEFDADIARMYRKRVSKDKELMDAIDAVVSLYRDRRRRITEEDEERCLALIGALRRALAKTCLAALQPDLVILDEFQRFGELFDDPDQNPSAELAHELFNYKADLRVLLLSATPYKMYASDDDSEDHYADFLRTLRFLMPNQPELVAGLEADIGEFRTGLLDIRSEADLAPLFDVKNRIEATLKRVMCRTERVGSTVRADAMVGERLLVPRLDARDLADFRTVDSIARRLEEPDTVEYWKSSPYLLNFMRDYSLKTAVREDQNNRQSGLADLLAPARGNTMSAASIDAYERLDPGNARLRTMLADIEARNLHRLLWMPPSLAYWKPAGVYEKVGAVSKQLIFSAWNVVPDALAALLSYDVERKIVHEANSGEPRYAELGKRFARRLRLARQGDGRLTGMWNLMLMYPSEALATLVDPLRWGGDEGCMLSLDEVRQRAVQCLAPHIEACVERTVTHGNEDRRWYWVALARLEASLAPGSRAWCAGRWRQGRMAVEAEEHEGPESDTVFSAHVQQWLAGWDGRLADLGRVPADLLDVLAALALAAPATCALRALSRQRQLAGADPNALLDAAARIAEGLRSQFNSPRAVALLKGNEDDGSYWQKVLHYCADGNLQAVLDEYVHVLNESKGRTRPELSPAEDLAESMVEAMTLHTVTLWPDELTVSDGRLRIEPFATGIRSHFAVRFGGKDEEEGSASRRKSVQGAFNSPFWPFVLVSTSVGQEGLDFHPWCHAVTHWNLPTNPVDMEQREGRVHRYKGYAVRKNIASKYGAAVRSGASTAADPWEELFALAVAERPAEANDLVPYWIYELEGGACVERRVMALPMSRDETRYRRLKRSLALYRMVFAQPRQEDLLACLEQTIGEERAAEVAARWRINLEPDVVLGE